MLTLLAVGIISFQGCKENSSEIPLSAIGSSEISGVSLSSIGKLTGLVIKESSTTGVPNITVVLKSASGSVQLDTTLTTGEGRFFFSKPTPGLYLLEVAVGSPDYVSQTYPVQIFSDGSMSPETIQVSLKSVSSPVYPEIQGTVVLNTSSEPLANISVILKKEDGSLVSQTITTGAGEFFFSENISTILYTLVIASGSQSGFREAQYTIRVMPDGTVSPENIRIPLSRLPTGPVSDILPVASGTIVDAYTGAPLEYVTCILKNHGNCLTDFNGRYVFTQLSPNTAYELEISKSGYNSMNVTFSIDENGIFLPRVLDYSLIYNQETNLGAIAGRIYDSSSNMYVGGIPVKVYRIDKITKTAIFPEGPITESQFAFESEFATQLIKETKTSSLDPTDTGMQFVGGYKVTHLPPATENSRYVVYIGSGDLIATSTHIGHFDWWVPTSNGSMQVWVNVSVSANTTTWLSNYDPPRD